MLSPRDQARRRAQLRLLMVPIAVFVASVIAISEFTIGFTESGLVGFVMLVAMVSLGIGVFLNLIRKRWSRAKMQALCLFALLASLPIGLRISNHHTRAAMADSQPVIEALQAFRDDTGRYPNELSELVPSHLDAIDEVGVTLLRSESLGYFGPERPVSRDGRGTQDTYVLVLSVGGFGGLLYTSESSVWRRTD